MRVGIFAFKVMNYRYLSVSLRRSRDRRGYLKNGGSGIEYKICVEYFDTID